MTVVAAPPDPKAFGRGEAAGPARSARASVRWSTRIGLGVAVLAVATGLATFMILTGLTPIKPAREVIVGLLGANMALIAAMAGLAGWQIWDLLIARGRRTAGAALHIRIVALLGLFAAVPAVIVAIFASVTLNRGLDAWFSERTRSIVDTSVSVAQAYLDEQESLARADISAIATDLNLQKELFTTDRQRFIRRMATLAALRSLAGAFLIDAEKRQVVASATASDKVSFRPPSDAMMEAAAKGELVVIGPGDGNVIQVLGKLPNFDNHFLYIYRLVNPEVIEQLAKAKEEKFEYDRLLEQRSGVQLTFAVMYAGVAFVFLLAAILLGLRFSDRLVEPVVGLVAAARRVSEGDLDVKVDVHKGTGDLATLGRAFNQMTDQLKAQRSELVEASHQIDERRRFIEAVLSGVSAGVLGLDGRGAITLANKSAKSLLGIPSGSLIGRRLEDVLAPVKPLLEQAQAKRSRTAEAQISMPVGSEERTFFVRVTAERPSRDEHGCVITFDDITGLVIAQRNSAWADIARRIAHEIKNPLTPIQLSAERLKRKYAKEIVSDPQVFEQCTTTIIRQVGDIGRMVDEFSSFARMPRATLEPHDMAEVVCEALVLQRVAAGDIGFQVDVPEGKIVFPFDRRLVTQAITNLVKNAREAIEQRLQSEPAPPGEIAVSLTQADGKVVIEVADNGSGLPKENRHRLTEPYITTREKGTGLGLAIVQRIMEEHGGSIVLADAPKGFHNGRGALVRLVFQHLHTEPAQAPVDGKEATEEKLAGVGAHGS
jgi:two-component system nitrogen regulation sensor histidine kinase NtrY